MSTLTAMQRIDQHVSAHYSLESQVRALSKTMAETADAIIASLSEGGHVFTFGNGGSAAEAQHFVGELIGRFKRDRPPLPAVALTADSAVSSCIVNDFGSSEVFSRQLAALGRQGDVAVGFSTSGTSPNVVQALSKARELGLVTVLFTGAQAPNVTGIADLAIVSPSSETARIQEIHQLAMHIIADLVDGYPFAEGAKGE